MDKSVHSAEVNEYTVRSDVLNSSFEYLTLFEFTDNFFLLCFQLSFDKSFVRNNDIFEFLIDLDDLEFHCFAYEYIVVAYRVNVNLTAWQECFNSEYVNNHTALSTALDVTLDNLFIFESCVNTVPTLAEACLLV